MNLRLPLHPAPIRGEALSSWVGRILHSYPERVRSKIAFEMGLGGIQIGHLDFGVSDDIYAAISQSTGVAISRIERMTVAALRRRIWSNGIARSDEPYSFLLSTNRLTLTERLYEKAWIGKEPKTYSMVCHRCLSEDLIEHNRLIWQLPLLASCPKHGILLQFGSPNFYQETRLPDRRGDRANPDKYEERSSPAVRRHDRRTMQALLRGKVRVPTGEIESTLWLRIVRGIIQELSRPRWAPKSKQQMMQQIRCAAVWKYKRQNVLDFERVGYEQQADRLRLVAAAIDLAERGEIRPHGACAEFILNT